jgi:SAM-dependent methyltransferase
MTQSDKFFDDEGVFTEYVQHRNKKYSANESLEKPIFFELLGSVKGKDILDLGSGDGVFGQQLIDLGCHSYLGIDSSVKMVEFAAENYQHDAFIVQKANIETWKYPESKFDLVTSRLALHYTEDLNLVFGQIHKSLRPGGRFVFSIVHPIITSSDASRNSGGKRQDWLVDNYFRSGPRNVFLMDKTVIQYHRTIEEIFHSLRQQQFSVEELRESKPIRDNFNNDELFDRRSRIPLFLFFSAEKH